MNNILLRSATVSDATLLHQWDSQPHVQAAVPEDDDWNWDYELPRSHDWRELLIAEYKGKPIGFIQIIDPAREETHYWGDVEEGLRAVDIWIGEEAFLNRGMGTEMLNLALDRCFSAPEVDAVIIDPLSSNTRAHRFYKRFGFTFVEERQFDDCLCHVYRLERERWL